MKIKHGISKRCAPKISHGNLKLDILEDWNFKNHEPRGKKTTMEYQNNSRQTHGFPFILRKHMSWSYLRLENPQDAHEVHCIRSLFCGALDTGDICLWFRWRCLYLRVVLMLLNQMKFPLNVEHLCWCRLYWPFGEQASDSKHSRI